MLASQVFFFHFTLIWLSSGIAKYFEYLFSETQCGTVKERKYRSLIFEVCSWLWKMPLGVVEGTETECLITALCVCDGAVRGNDRRQHRDPSTCCEKVTGTAIALLQSWLQMYFPCY